MKTKRTVQKILAILCVLMFLTLFLVGCNCKHSAESELVGSRSYLHMNEETRKCSRCGEQFELFYLDLQLDDIVSVKLVSPDGTLLQDIDSDEEISQFVSFFSECRYEQVLEFSDETSSVMPDYNPDSFDEFFKWEDKFLDANFIEIQYSDDVSYRLYLLSSREILFLQWMDVYVCHTDARHPYWNY